MRSGDDVAVETPAMGVFDCDGVLVDSEMLACRVEAELLSGLGLSVTAHEIAARFVGLSDSEMHALIEDEFGVALSATFNTDKVKRLAEVFEAELRPVDGIAEVVAAVSVPRCVASSSDPVRIRRSLELTGLAQFFGPHVFSASMVALGKPAPDLFLLAAQAMHAQPNRCLVIEDSTHGVAAGVAAGMTVIGFTAGSHSVDGLADRLIAQGARKGGRTSKTLLTLRSDARSARCWW
jgi:HAD superfamily hydrolase (TIGR01509 family)